MDDRDRGTPIPLAAHPPVAQPPRGRRFTPGFGLGARDHRPPRSGDVHPVEEARIDDSALAGERDFAFENLARRIAIGDNSPHIEPVFAREIEVALVVRRHPHHRARSVIDQHEIGDEDGQRDLRVERMGDAKAGVEARFFLRLDFGGGRSARLAALDKRRGLG